MSQRGLESSLLRSLLPLIAVALGVVAAFTLVGSMVAWRGGARAWVSTAVATLPDQLRALQAEQGPLDDALAARLSGLTGLEVVLYRDGLPVGSSLQRDDGAPVHPRATEVLPHHPEVDRRDWTLPGYEGFVLPTGQVVRGEQLTMIQGVHPLRGPDDSVYGHVVLLLPEDVVVAGPRRTARISLAVLLLVLAATGLAVVRIARGQARPLAAVAEEMRALTEDMAERLGAPSTPGPPEASEVGELRAALQRLEGSVRQAVAFRHVLEETREAARVLAEARDEAVRDSRQKSRFLANMSHELRTPLNAVIGYTELVLEDLRHEDAQGHAPDLEQVLRAARHLLSLIDQVLDLTRIESGRLAVDWQNVDVRQLVKRVEQVAAPLAAVRRNRLQVDAWCEGLVIRSDARRIEQILANLVSNAARFTDEGEIRLAAVQEGEHLVLSVADTGIGIADEHLETIFDAFSQVDVSSTRAYDGSGMGLAICRRLADLLQGEISVESTPGRGSTFRLVLPLRPEEAHQATGSQ